MEITPATEEALTMGCLSVNVIRGHRGMRNGMKVIVYRGKNSGF